MFLQSRALRSRVEKSSILESILESKTGQKSMKTEVRKRIENRSPSGSDFYRFFDDFGTPRPPKKRPKIVKNRTFGPLGPKTRTLKDSGGQFGPSRTLASGSGPFFHSILGPEIVRKPSQFEELTV